MEKFWQIYYRIPGFAWMVIYTVALPIIVLMIAHVLFWPEVNFSAWDHTEDAGLIAGVGELAGLICLAIHMNR